MNIRRLLLILVAAICVVLVSTTVIWDRTQADMVASDVRVDTVSLGGLSVTQARRKLTRTLEPGLMRPVRVTFGGHTHYLPVAAVDLGVDVNSSVQAAVDKGRSGGILARLWRRLTGAKVEANLPVRIDFDRDALNVQTAKIKKAVDRPARDATVAYSASSVAVTPAETGITVNRRRLKRAILLALHRRGRGRVVSARGKTVHPKVTSADVRSSYPVIVTVDRTAKRVRLWQRFKLAKMYTVAVGQLAYQTPAGLHQVQTKSKNPTWTPPNSDWVPKKLRGKTIPAGDPGNPLKARFIAFDGAAGFHGTDDLASLGTAASHGCIRMAIGDVKELYNEVGIGTPVYIS